MAKKSPGTIALYATILACALFFFLLGVWVGSRLSAGSPAAVSLPASTEPVEDPRSELGFYEELTTPRDERPEEARDPAGEQSEPSRAAPQVVIEPAVAKPASRPPEEKPPAVAPRQGSTAERLERFTIQVGAHRTASEARQIVLRLQSKGYAAELIEPIPSDSEFYRVWVGAFPTREEAVRLERELKKDEFPTYVKKVDASRFPN